MAERGQGSAKTKPVRRRPKSDVLTVRQAVWISIGAGLVILSVAILFWNGFPVGHTIAPIAIGTMFIVMICYTIKTGVFQWKGGGRTLRNQEPFAFWFWVSVFAAVGLLAIFVGSIKLLKHFVS